MLFQRYALVKYLLSGLCRLKIRLHVLCSMIFIYALRKRSANHTQGPKSSSWNSPRPFYYNACIREVFTSIFSFSHNVFKRFLSQGHEISLISQSFGSDIGYLVFIFVVDLYCSVPFNPIPKDPRF